MKQRFATATVFAKLGFTRCNMETATPMLRQYLDIKKLYPGTILFFRLGDFYEMFNEDAIVGSRELDITLTARQKDSPNPIPMCGVPHHAAAGYIARLVRKGYRVAICEQTESPAKGVKLVKREVVRVITPGTAIDPQLLESREAVYLASVCGSGERFGTAFLETSSGQFSATEFSGRGAWQKTCEEIEAFGPRELLYPESLEHIVKQAFGTNANRADRSLFEETANIGSSITLTPRTDPDFDEEYASDLLKRHMEVAELSGFGFDGHSAAVGAAGACLKYAQDTQKAAAGHISEIQYFESSDFMVLDAVTLRNLEIFESRGEKSKNTLFGVIDETVTGMGSRL
ncbi:MAG: DNA mismatch repair protein MutS, partial [Pyrinomonadaceae bacterium]